MSLLAPSSYPPFQLVVQEYTDGNSRPHLSACPLPESLSPNAMIFPVLITGTAKVGKSTLANKLLDREESNGFKIGHSVQAETKGIWACIDKTLVKTSFGNADAYILYLDCQTMATDCTSLEQNLLVALGIRICSAMLLNTGGALEQSKIMDLLALITLSLKQLGEVDQKPALFWLLRDLHLDLGEMDADEYLNRSLKKEWKDVILTSFSSMRCFGLPNLTHTDFVEDISLSCDVSSITNNSLSILVVWPRQAEYPWASTLHLQ